MTDLPDAERFMAKVQKADDGCWLWTGFVSADGYGQFRFGPVMVKAHRWAYTHYAGQIPPGMETDHLCRVRRCVNPDHLEVVTHAENMARSSAAKTHCKNGHEFTPENTRLRSRDGKRDCRACNKIAVQKYQAKRKAENNG